jgi:tetratricopeptide (TPR) repeat protein
MFRVSIADREAAVDGRAIRLSPQFFQLYCFLAYERACGRDHFLTVGAIHLLPAWRRARLESIGKSIHRHNATRGRVGQALIESPPRASTKLFRLRVPPADISFDAALAEVRDFLGLDLLQSAGSPEAVAQGFRFAWAVIRARLDLERGNLVRARAALEEAEKLPRLNQREQVQTLLLRSTLLEQGGQPLAALAAAAQAFAITQEGMDYLTQARARIRLGFLGSMLRQPERYPQAKRHYLQAHRLLNGSRHFIELAQIATGLGHLARREGDLDTAVSYFVKSLEYAAAEGWAWGIQAGLFNLGLVHAERADVLGESARQRAAYRHAQFWLERAIEFTETTGVGRYSSEALGVLSHVLLQQGQGAAAVRWARLALERARTAENKKSEAVALEALGQALLATGSEDALKVLAQACGAYRQLGFEPDAQRVAQLAARRRRPPRTA